MLTGDGDYSPAYSPNYFQVISLSALQMQIELGALQAQILGLPNLWLDAQYTLGQLQSGETFLPTEPHLLGTDWMWSNTQNRFERSAPTYQLSPKVEAHAWTIAHDGQGGFTLAPQLSRPSSQFVAAATGGGADTLEGGKGSDTLYGGTGGDTYHFALGDGEDHVYDSLAGGDNILSFGAGIGRGDVRLAEDEEGLTVFYGDGDDSIRLPGADRDDAVFRPMWHGRQACCCS